MLLVISVSKGRAQSETVGDPSFGGVVSNQALANELEGKARKTKIAADELLQLKSLPGYQRKKGSANLDRMKWLEEYELGLYEQYEFVLDTKLSTTQIGIMAENGINPVVCNPSHCRYRVSTLNKQHIDSIVAKLRETGEAPSSQSIYAKKASDTIENAPSLSCLGNGIKYNSVEDCVLNSGEVKKHSDANTKCFAFDPKNGKSYQKALLENGKLTAYYSRSGLKLATNGKNCASIKQSIDEICPCVSTVKTKTSQLKDIKTPPVLEPNK